MFRCGVVEDPKLTSPPHPRAALSEVSSAGIVVIAFMSHLAHLLLSPFFSPRGMDTVERGPSQGGWLAP